MKRLIIYLFLLALFISGCANSQLSVQGTNEKGSSQSSHIGNKLTTTELMPGTQFATNVYIHESENPGPAVMVVGGIHGNEPAGALAAQKFNNVSLIKGTLIVIPRANAVALEENVRTLPEIGDLNRAYPGKRDGVPAEQITFEIVELMKKYDVAMVLDLHEGYAFNSEDPKSVGETVLPGKDDTSILLAVDAVEFINKQITDPRKRFSVLANPIIGSTAYYANSVLNRVAFTIETSSKQPLDDRVNYSFEIAKFLVASQGIL